MMLRQSLWATIATLPVLLGAAGGSTIHVADPLTSNLAANDEDTQMEFWHTLNGRKITSNDEAFHGLILFIEGQDDAADYAGRVEWLNEREMLPRDFDLPSNEAVRRGTMAVAISRILEIKGGLVMRVFGPSPRYATRELQYLNILPPSSPHQTLSGMEFVGLIGRIEDYERVKHVVDSESVRDEQEASETPPQ